MIDFAKLVRDEIDRRGWTPYRLHRACDGRVTQPTIYNLLEGKPVKSDTLAVVFDVLGFGVIAPEIVAMHLAMQPSLPKPKPARKPKKEARK